MDNRQVTPRGGIALLTVFVFCSCNASPVEVIANCANNAPPDIKGLELLSDKCPELQSAIDELKLNTVLQADWETALDRDTLHEIVHLMSAPATKSEVSPNVKDLNEVLSQLAKEQPQVSPSWWDKFTKWLRSWLGSHEVKSVPWLDKLLRNLAEKASVVTIITYLLAAVLLCVAVWFVVRELRIAGLIGKKSSRTAAQLITSPSLVISRSMTLQDINNAPLEEKPSLLLQILIDDLTHRGKLQAHRNLTHRELSARRMFANVEDDECFANVSLLAEELMYGDQPFALDKVTSVVTAGVALVKRSSHEIANS